MGFILFSFFFFFFNGPDLATKCHFLICIIKQRYCAMSWFYQLKSFFFHNHKIYVKHHEQLLYALLAVLQLGSYCVIFEAQWLLNMLCPHHTNYCISHFRWPPWKLLPKVYMSEITFKMLMKWRIFTALYLLKY